MRGVRNKRRVWSRSWLSQILLLVFALRALVPTGYMPQFSGNPNGTVSVVICSAAGARAMTMDLGGEQTPQAVHDHQLCPYGGLADPQTPVDAKAPLLKPQYAVAFVTAAHSTVLPPTRAGPAVGARAPPSTSDC